MAAKTAPGLDVRQQLDLAFDKVDRTVGLKLTQLKNEYNQIAAIQNATSVQVAPPKARGAPRPEKAPNGRPKPPQKRTRSGRFYLQLSQGANQEEFLRLKDKVSKAGRIVDSGRGTASDPDAAWMEVAVRAEDTTTLMIKLEEIDVDKDRVERVVEVTPGEGQAQARNLALFPKASGTQ